MHEEEDEEHSGVKDMAANGAETRLPPLSQGSASAGAAMGWLCAPRRSSLRSQSATG